MKLKLWLNIAALVAFGALIYFAREDIGDTLRTIDDVNIVALLAMVPIQLFSYHAVTRLYLDYFRAVGDKLHYWPVYKTSLELNFVNQVFPSGGVSGVSYLSYRMKQFGIPYAKSTLAQIARFALTFITFQMMLFVGLAILVASDKASPITITVTFAIAVAILSGTFFMVYIISDKERIKQFTSFIARNIDTFVRLFRRKETINIERVRKLFGELHDDYEILSSKWKNLVGPGIWSLLANIAEVATIYAVYVAFGEWVNVGAVIIAYAVANFAGAVAILPGGVGVYEALMTSIMVSAGVPFELSLSVTIMYRVLNMLFFLPIGYFLYNRAIHKHT